MTLAQAIAYADAVKPNAFTNDVKTTWINEVEGMVQTEIMLIAAADIVQYTYATDSADTLLVAAPHDKLYRSYLIAMIDFMNGEYSKYANTFALFNSHYAEYMKWYAQKYHPADGLAEDDGYYISAYGIAVKNGYIGTEIEWLASLSGTFSIDENMHLIVTYGS